uniref:Uncharacterized protein n=1 Tax=viral metagenome TaxID=1070528 RepID=A0A6C0FAU1_9ZZZZ
MNILTKLKNAFQSIKKHYINPIGDYVHDYCANRYITYLDHEERTRGEIEIIGLPINERYLGYISHIIAAYKMVDIYYSYYNIAMWCCTHVIAWTIYFTKSHRD